MSTVNSFRLLTAALTLAGSAAGQTHVEVTSRLGTKFSSLSDDKGVVAAAKKNLGSETQNPDLLLKLAQAQVSVWQDREAVETLTRALAISPQNASLYTERGHREVPLRQFAQARADLSRAVALNPKHMARESRLALDA